MSRQKYAGWSIRIEQDPDDLVGKNTWEGTDMEASVSNYAGLVSDHLREIFPGARVEFVTGGICRTGYRVFAPDGEKVFDDRYGYTRVDDWEQIGETLEWVHGNVDWYVDECEAAGDDRGAD